MKYLYLSVAIIFFLLIITPHAFSESPSFTIAPGKLEIEAAPGQTVTAEIIISNNLGRESTFQIEFEDVMPDEAGGVRFLGNELSPTSLKNYLLTPTQTVVIPRGGEMRVPISIVLPAGLAGGSLHAAILASPVLSSDSTTTARPRLGILAFVKVDGERKESGKLVGISSKKMVYLGGGQPVFLIEHQNSGNTYLNPYGLITLKNMITQKKEVLPVKPWFVLPASSRTLEISDSKKGFGLYRATLEQNRGYENIIDRDTAWFLVLPWWSVGVIFVVLAGVLVLLGKRSVIKYFYA